MTIQAVIFDFDGVLADTERLHLHAVQEALAVYGRTLDEAAYFASYLGFNDHDLVLEFARDQGWAVNDELLEAIVTDKARRYRDHLTAGDALYSTAAACVRRLGSQFALAIASGSLHAEIQTILASGHLQDAFRVVVGADHVTNGKPAPDSYLKAAEWLGIDPAVAVAIEDSRWGLESARTAGMRTIAITTSYPASALSMSDLIVASLDEISVAVIERVGE